MHSLQLFHERTKRSILPFDDRTAHLWYLLREVKHNIRGIGKTTPEFTYFDGMKPIFNFEGLVISPTL